MGHFFSTDKMTCRLDFVQSNLYIVVPSTQLVICLLTFLIKYDNTLKAINFG